MASTLHVFQNLADLSAAAAQHFTQTIHMAVQERGLALAALSGGSTPQALFKLLAAFPYRENLPWGKIHFFWCDERCVPAENPESNYGQARSLLFNHLPIPAQNIHPVPGELAPEAACADYIHTLQTFGYPNQAWPTLDWVLLGLGADGHTASLFPGQVNPLEENQPAIAVTAHYQERPANRVSLTPQVFNSARQIVFLVTGSNKANALRDVLTAPNNPLWLPAQRIKPSQGEITWLVDAEAASVAGHR
jgi:6-phosphogluconolactonase